MSEVFEGDRRRGMPEMGRVWRGTLRKKERWGGEEWWERKKDSELEKCLTKTHVSAERRADVGNETRLDE